MNCDDVQESLELLALGEIGEPRRGSLLAHIGACARCRQAMNEVRAGVTGLRESADEPLVRAEFARVLRADIASEIGTRRWRRQAGRAIAALAATVLVCALLWRVGGGREQPPVRDLWRYSGVAASAASPADRMVVRDGAMFVLRRNEGACYVAAIDMASGRPRWQSDAPCLGYLAADDSRVFALASPEQGRLGLVALDATDGHEVWRFSVQKRRRLEAPARPTPVGAGRVGWAVGGRACLLDAATGALLWQWRGDGRSGVAVVGDGEKLYAVNGRSVQCLDLATGAAMWTAELPAPVAGVKRPMAALAHGRLYVVQIGRALSARLVCMDLATRRILWHRDAQGAHDLAVADDGVYLRGQEIAAFDAATGAQLWSRAAHGCGPLTLAGGMIHFADSSKAGALVALDQRTGKEEWSLAGVRSCDALNTWGTTGYVKTLDGVVHAIRLTAARRS